jgi:predicted Na+-dependent transporter
MLLPLAAGLIIKARYDEAAEGLQRVFAQAVNIGLILLVVLGIALNFKAMLGYLLVVALIGLIVLMPTAGEFGRRTGVDSPE